MKELRWPILNKSVESNEEKKWTYTGKKRESVFDYVLKNKETREVRKLRVEDRIDSDHQPLTV